MTQRRLVAAYKALSELYGREWPFRQAYALMKLMGELQAAYDFQAAQEERLLAKYGGEVREGGLAVFDAPEKRAAFEEELNALGDMEQAPPEGAPAKLTVGRGLSISPRALKALEGFVEFEEV